MLQTIREKLTGWFAIFILGAIALTLVISFGNIDTGFSGGAVAASVNGEDIAVREFRQLYQQQRQQWEASYRTQMPEVLAEEMGNSVIQSLVRNRVVAQYVRDEGYRINDDDVIASITDIEAFKVGGRFSQPAYEQLLQSQGLNRQRFEYEQRQSMQMNQFAKGLASTAFYTPAEFRRYIELDGESRDLEYVVLNAADWSKDVAVSEDTIQQYYDANPLNYQSEESVSLVYVEIDYASIINNAAIGDEEAQSYFDENPDEFRGPDERHARHILVPFAEDEAEAAKLSESLRQRLLAGESFAELAVQYSADTGTAGSGGDLGWLGSGDAPAAEFEDALFVLAENEISSPVRTEYGFHLIRLDGIRAGDVLDFGQVKDALLTRLRDDAAADVYGELLDELDELALESLDGLAPVAEAMGLELGQIDSFTRSGGLPLGYNPLLVDTVFSLEVLEDGENSPVIDLGEGRAVVVQVTEYQPSTLKPFAAVRDEILARITGDEAVLLAAARGNELVARLDAGDSPDELLQALGRVWNRPEGVRRGSPDIAADLAAAIFRAPKPEMLDSGDMGKGYQGLMLASGDFAVFRVVAVHSGQPELYTQEDRDLRKGQLASRLGGGQATAVVEALVAESDVRVTPDLIGNQSDLL
jgi:peptidyl-prolyl cis-trans isomerase D